MQAAVWLMTKPALFNFVGKIARKVVPKLPKALVYNKFNAWGKQRDLPSMPEKSFKDLYKEGLKDD